MSSIAAKPTKLLAWTWLEIIDRIRRSSRSCQNYSMKTNCFVAQVRRSTPPLRGGTSEEQSKIFRSCFTHSTTLRRTEKRTALRSSTSTKLSLFAVSWRTCWIKCAPSARKRCALWQLRTSKVSKLDSWCARKIFEVSTLLRRRSFKVENTKLSLWAQYAVVQRTWITIDSTTLDLSKTISVSTLHCLEVCRLKSFLRQNLT